MPVEAPGGPRLKAGTGNAQLAETVDWRGRDKPKKRSTRHNVSAGRGNCASPAQLGRAVPETSNRELGPSIGPGNHDLQTEK